MNAVARIAALMALQSRGFMRPLKKNLGRKTPPVLVEWMPVHTEETQRTEDEDDEYEDDEETLRSPLRRDIESLKSCLDDCARRRRYDPSYYVRTLTLREELLPFFGLDLVQPELELRFSRRRRSRSADPDLLDVGGAVPSASFI